MVGWTALVILVAASSFAAGWIVLRDEPEDCTPERPVVKLADGVVMDCDFHPAPIMLTLSSHGRRIAISDPAVLVTANRTVTFDASEFSRLHGHPVLFHWRFSDGHAADGPIIERGFHPGEFTLVVSAKDGVTMGGCGTFFIRAQWAVPGQTPCASSRD